MVEEALRQGNMELFELSPQLTKDLGKVRKTAETHGNMFGRFQITMYHGDVESRLSGLRDCVQTAPG